MSKVFRGGIPTDGDVKRLLAAFPDIKPGDTVSYAAIAEIIKIEHGSNRFQSVTNAWRRAVVRTLNFVLEAVPGAGFRRCTEIERSQRDRSGWRKDQTRAARKVRDLARVDTSDFADRDQRTHDHARRVLQAHVEHTSTTVRELAPPAPLRLLPKREAV